MANNSDGSHDYENVMFEHSAGLSAAAAGLRWGLVGLWKSNCHHSYFQFYILVPLVTQLLGTALGTSELTPVFNSVLNVKGLV